MSAQIKSASEYFTDEVVDRGEELYQSGIRQELEIDSNIGKLLMIDVETGEWEWSYSKKAHDTSNSSLAAASQSSREIEIAACMF